MAGEYIPSHTIPKLMKAFRDGEIDKAVLPIGNSTEGVVTAAIDNLINGDGNGWSIEGEIVLPVIQNLLGRGRIEDIKTVTSHPQALSQCAKFLDELGAKLLTANSTSEAAAAVAAGQDLTLAAIASLESADECGLPVLAVGIQENPKNETRFLVLGRDVSQKMTGNDKTSFIIEVDNGPGCLYKPLGVLAALDINMANLVSRPAKRNIDDILFYIEIDGHIIDIKIKVALDQIRTRTNFLKILGSYPKFVH